MAIFVTTGLDAENLALQAAVVQEARKSVPAVWFVLGDLFGDTLWAEMSESEAQVRLLNAAGVDAVLMGPEWFWQGTERVRSLADMGRFYLLAANIVDTARRAIGHEFMVRQLGPIAFGATGICLDTSAAEFKQADLMFLPVNYVASRVGAILRRRAELTAILVGPHAVWQHLDYDLIVAPENSGGAALTPCQEPELIARYDVAFDAGTVASVTKREVVLSGYEPAGVVTRMRDSLARAIDSQAAVVVAESRVAVTPSVLSRVLARAFIAEQRADYVVFDTLTTETILPGRITQGALCRDLYRAGRPVLLELEGRQVQDLLRTRGVIVESRPGIRSQPLALRRKYMVLTTTEFLRRRPGLTKYGYRMVTRSLWRLAAAFLSRESGMR